MHETRNSPPKTFSRRHFLLGSSALAASAAATLLLPSCARRPKEVDVAVLGAGYAGMQATRLLREAGVRVALLEGSVRVGGRVHTFDHLPGRPEAGATELGNSYTELLALCRQYGIATASLEGSYASAYALSVGGQLLSQQAWPDSDANRLSRAERNTPPQALLRRYLPRQLPIDSLDDWGGPAWASHDIALANQLRLAGASTEAIRLIAANLNGHDIEDLSWADLLKSLLVRRLNPVPGTFKIAGGLSQVSARLANKAGDSLMLGTVVREISPHAGGLEISASNGARVTARLAISALPFSTLRQVAIRTPLSEAKRAAIRGLRYTPVTRVFLRAQHPFWLDDGLPKDTWTDSPLGRIFVNPDADGDAGIGVGVFAMGPAAQKLDQVLAGGKQRALDLLHQIRPSTKGALTVEDSISWGSNPFSLGAFSHYPAGGVTAYGRAVATPEGALLFAGEHTELRSPGVEAALVSGRRTAEQALAMLRGEAAA